MEKQYTAVELLERRIMNTSITSNGQMIFYHAELKRWLDEAKAMEKDEQKNIFVEGMYKGQELYFGEHKIKLDVNTLDYSLNIAEKILQ